MANSVRLDKYLADAGMGTRSEARKNIRKGLVTVDGLPILKPEQKITPGSSVMFSGEPVAEASEFVYYLLNKPAGYVSATEDRSEPTVMDLVPDKRRGLFPVGRLDKDTEGLLLITDDGLLAHQLLSPKKHVDKTYFVRIRGDWNEEKKKLLETGVDIGDEKITLPAVVEELPLHFLGQSEDGSFKELKLTIREGRYHQIKRMMKAVDCEVVFLKRLSMGSLMLPEDLKTGQCRALTPAEIAGLKDVRRK